MVRKLIRSEEFIDDGFPYIRDIYDDGSKHIRQKDGVEYPEPSKTEEELEKEQYANLSTDTDRVDVIAKKLGLK